MSDRLLRGGVPWQVTLRQELAGNPTGGAYAERLFLHTRKGGELRCEPGRGGLGGWLSRGRRTYQLEVAGNTPVLIQTCHG
eukprot:3321160-Pyramimonas_sp.AAC.1